MQIVSHGAMVECAGESGIPYIMTSTCPVWFKSNHFVQINTNRPVWSGKISDMLWQHIVQWWHDISQSEASVKMLWPIRASYQECLKSVSRVLCLTRHTRCTCHRVIITRRPIRGQCWDILTNQSPAFLPPASSVTCQCHSTNACVSQNWPAIVNISEMVGQKAVQFYYFQLFCYFSVRWGKQIICKWWNGKPIMSDHKIYLHGNK